MTSDISVYILMYTSVYSEIQGVWKLSLQLPSCVRTLWKDTDMLLIVTELSRKYGEWKWTHTLYYYQG